MKKNLDELKVAIVCDWLTGIGGAERVVLELHKMFPKAPIYTSQYSPDEIDWFVDADIRTTWLQKMPKRLKKFLPVLRAMSFSHLDLSEYDLVISSSGAEAKAVKTGPQTIHINYCHSPTQYYWARYSEYLKNPGFGALDWLARLGLKLLVGPMRKWDYKAAKRPDYMVANSTFTRSNIKQYYGREATVIHPPVDIDRFKLDKSKKREGLVIAGRQTPYKRIDLAVDVCTKLNINLVVIGNGPEHSKLVNMASPTITFITDAKDSDMPGYLQSAEAFIFPGIDDFGIVAVEAMAAGTPVIGYAIGGPKDYVISGETGLLFQDQSEESLSEAIREFQTMSFDHQKISNSAQAFSPSHFHKHMSEFIAKVV